jgi:hypothetical protein
MIPINSERNVYVTFDSKKFFYLFGTKVKNHDYSMYLDVGENPKCQIVRHLSCIWDVKLNGKQQFIKHQIGDVKINLLFDIENLLKKKGGELDHGNHYIIDCSNIDDSSNRNFRLNIRLLSSLLLKPSLSLFLQFPKYENIAESYLYLDSIIELKPSNAIKKLVNDVHIDVTGELSEIEERNLDEIQKRVTLSMSSGKAFLSHSDKKNYRILYVHRVDMRDKPKLIAESECGLVISGKATSKTYMTSFDVPINKSIKSITLDAEL